MELLCVHCARNSWPSPVIDSPLPALIMHGKSARMLSVHLNGSEFRVDHRTATTRAWLWDDGVEQFGNRQKNHASYSTSDIAIPRVAL